MKILTFDIGGAYTKKLAVDFGTDGVEIISNDISYFPFWKRKDEFEGFLESIKEDAEKVGIAITAELSDAFSTKRDGVKFIITICEKVFETPFYLSTEGSLLSRREVGNYKDLAASNWLASVYFLKRRFKEGILVDIGSTTTDLIPFSNNDPLQGKTDLERLIRSQLLYTGILRTPLNAIVKKVPFRGKLVSISAEYFAITADLYNILGYFKDYSCETPDGRGKSKGESMRRVARLLCSDIDDIGEGEIIKICKYIMGEQISDIATALKKVVEETGICTAYICGIGRELAKEACARNGINFSEIKESGDNLPCLGLAYMVRDHVNE